MTARPWIDNSGHKLMTAQGVPYLCEECPCDEPTACAELLDTRASAYLAMTDEHGAYIYTLASSKTANYTCPKWEQVGGEWVKTRSGDGQLIVALPRPLQYPDFSSSHVLCTQAVVLRNNATGLTKLLACACSSDGHNCRDGAFVDYDGYEIAGLLDADADIPCKVDNCELSILRIDHAFERYGGKRYGNGYIGEWDGVQFSYTVFKKAYTWTQGDARMVATIECQCTANRPSVAALTSTQTVNSAPGICDTPCQDLFALHQSALQNGWTWHGSGFIIHKEYNFEGGDCNVCSWYDIGDKRPVLGAAETDTAFYYVSCGCSTGTQRKDKFPSSTPEEPPEGCDPGEDFWTFQADPTACNGNQGGGGDVPCGTRELLLTYPELFGVVSLAWSTDQRVIINGGVSTVAQMMGDGDNDYIDYRTLSVVTRVCGGGYKLTAYNAPGGKWGGSPTLYKGQYLPEFLGERQTFGTDPRVGYRTGHVYAWWAKCGYGGGGEESGPFCFDNKDDADELFEYLLQYPPRKIACGISDYAQEAHESITEPESEFEFTAGGVREVVHTEEIEGPGGEPEIHTWSEWCVYPDKRCPAGGFDGYYGRAIYYLNWIYTNKGILINGDGLDVYHETYPFYGIKASYGDPSWDNCFGHSPVPGFDGELEAVYFDPDYHWCDPDFVPPEHSDSESEIQINEVI